MAKRVIDCPECGTKSTIIAVTLSPVQCCPFCGNTLLPADNEDDDDDFVENDDDLHEFDPDGE
jgi:uncharacterized paraquat-inducible protein A